MTSAEAQRQTIHGDAACGLRRGCESRRRRGLRRMQVQLGAQLTESVAEGEAPTSVVRRAAHRGDQMPNPFDGRAFS